VKIVSTSKNHGNRAFLSWQGFQHKKRNSKTVRGINLFLASSSLESWELVHGQGHFSQRCEVHALLSFTNLNWLWQLVVIFSRDHYVWLHFLVSFSSSSYSPDFLHPRGQSAKSCPPTITYPTSNLHLNERWLSKIGTPIPHSILKNIQKFEYCTYSRWDIRAEKKWKKSCLYCSVAYLIFCFRYRLQIFTQPS
jgi:hypothetical protein